MRRKLRSRRIQPGYSEDTGRIQRGYSGVQLCTTGV